MERVTARLREIFEAPRAEVRLVATGTAANALGLACLCPPWATVYCHAEAHANADECGAPEFYSGGAKLTGLGGDHGRIDPEALDRALAGAEETGVHNVQRGALTLTNATEAGTVYDPDAVARLAGAARGYGLPVHMDGARFANALVAPRLHAGGGDLEGGRRRAELRGHQERLPRGRGGGALRARAGVGARAPAEARRAPVLQAPLPLGADGGLSRRRPVAGAGAAGERPGGGARARDRGPSGGAPRPSGRGERGVRGAAAGGAPGGACGRGALLPLAGEPAPRGSGRGAAERTLRVQLVDDGGGCGGARRRPSPRRTPAPRAEEEVASARATGRRDRKRGLAELDRIALVAAPGWRSARPGGRRSSPATVSGSTAGWRSGGRRMERLAVEGIAVGVTPLGGMLTGLEIERDGRRIAPLHRAPWVGQGEAMPAEAAPHLGVLEGDFFCAPFGRTDEDGVPAHGWPANGDWRARGVERAADGGGHRALGARPGGARGAGGQGGDAAARASDRLPAPRPQRRRGGGAGRAPRDDPGSGRGAAFLLGQGLRGDSCRRRRRATRRAGARFSPIRSASTGSPTSGSPTGRGWTPGPIRGPRGRRTS